MPPGSPFYLDSILLSLVAGGADDDGTATTEAPDAYDLSVPEAPADAPAEAPAADAPGEYYAGDVDTSNVTPDGGYGQADLAPSGPEASNLGYGNQDPLANAGATGTVYGGADPFFTGDPPAGTENSFGRDPQVALGADADPFFTGGAGQDGLEGGAGRDWLGSAQGDAPFGDRADVNGPTPGGHVGSLLPNLHGGEPGVLPTSAEPHVPRPAAPDAPRSPELPFTGDPILHGTTKSGNPLTPPAHDVTVVENPVRSAGPGEYIAPEPRVVDPGVSETSRAIAERVPDAVQATGSRVVPGVERGAQHLTDIDLQVARAGVPDGQRGLVQIQQKSSGSPAAVESAFEQAGRNAQAFPEAKQIVVLPETANTATHPDRLERGNAAIERLSTANPNVEVVRSPEAAAEAVERHFSEVDRAQGRVAEPVPGETAPGEPGRTPGATTRAVIGGGVGGVIVGEVAHAAIPAIDRALAENAPEAVTDAVRATARTAGGAMEGYFPAFTAASRATTAAADYLGFDRNSTAVRVASNFVGGAAEVGATFAPGYRIYQGARLVGAGLGAGYRAIWGY